MYILTCFRPDQVWHYTGVRGMMSARNMGGGTNLGDFGFVWEEYLEASKTVEVPPIMFQHVEMALESGIKLGMAMEVPTSTDSGKDGPFWVARVVMICGPLLRMRFFGGDDRRLEFWFNLTKDIGHELGWCVRNNKELQPPEGVLQRSPDCLEKLPEYLMSAKSIPQEMLTGEELCLPDKILKGMKVEVSDPEHPYKLWIATVMQNVGGRLLLRYDTPGVRIKDFWVFCTSEHLHQYGFASKSDPKWFLEPPSAIVERHAYEEWKELTESGPSNVVTKELFSQEVEHPRHNFKVGMKLEAIMPTQRTHIAPATIVKIFDDIHFLVKIDKHDEDDNNSGTAPPAFVGIEKNTWLCTASHPYIFPVGWAESHGLQITRPRGWRYDGEDFDWDAYLVETESIAAPAETFSERGSAVDAGYEKGMRLEAVDPRDDNILCAAHIEKVVENLLWIKLDNFEKRREHIVHMHSKQIFPIGWSESNNYPLKPPRDYIRVCNKNFEDPEEGDDEAIIDVHRPIRDRVAWCPKIFINYRCFTGPLISKGKLATLPKSVGPGPVVLVMKEVLTMIVSVGYRSARILKLLQCEERPDPGFQLEVIKAKHKTNTYRGSVAVINSEEMVPEFCREICKKLSVCPNLFGPIQVPEEDCPARCNKSSKNKFMTSIVGTGKRGKPKGYRSLLIPKAKPVFRGTRKRRRGRLTNKEVKDNLCIFEDDDEMPYLPTDLAPHLAEGLEGTLEERLPLMAEADMLNEKSLEQKLDKCDDLKDKCDDVPSSNGSDDSRSSFTDRKSKDSSVGSPRSMNSKATSSKCNQNGSAAIVEKRMREWENTIDSDDPDIEYVRAHHKQRRPKTRKLESNPLFWSIDDVFRYLSKTNDCKEVAHRLKEEEIDGLAFLLLNLPSLLQHMKLRTSTAMKLCRHVEQVKVTFFLKHLNKEEPKKCETV